MELVIAMLLLGGLIALDFAALRWGCDSRDAARGDLRN